jgi:hypothetical protein
MKRTFDRQDTPLPLDYYERKYCTGRTTLWRYRNAGLPYVRVGRKCFVRESDFVAFLQRMNAKRRTS